MIKSMGIASIMLLGFSVSFMDSTETLGQGLRDSDLVRLTGGADQFCVKITLDLPHIHCPTCVDTSTPTAFSSEDCTSTDLSYNWGYLAGQSPAERWDTQFAVGCTGMLRRYGGSFDCISNPASPPLFVGPCSRSINTATFLGYPPGVSCP